MVKMELDLLLVVQISSHPPHFWVIDVTIIIM